MKSVHREKVLELKRKGLSHRAVAAKLEISKSTVSHICSEAVRTKAATRWAMGRASFNSEIKKAAGGKCAHCGYDRCMRALQFHHTDRSQKIKDINLLIRTSKKELVLAEVAKCILLCANCHAEHHEGLW